METGVLHLSWELLLTVATGYSGYFVANVGARAHHRTIDVTFSTLVYGFFGTFGYLVALAFAAPIWVATPIAFVVAMVSGGLWAKYLREGFAQVLRDWGVSHNDDYVNALDSLFQVKGIHATQLSIRLTDGRWLLCDDLARFANHPNGPCVIGPSGDVLIYVTDVKLPDGDWEPRDPSAEGWGTEVTYIPAAQIARIDLRRKKPVSPS